MKTALGNRNGGGTGASDAPKCFERTAATPVRRRGFFAIFGIGAASRLTYAGAPAATVDRVRSYLIGDTLMLEKLTHEMLAPHLGDSFQLDVGAGGSVELKLSSVTPLAPVLPDRKQPFSLLFVTPARAALPQRMYTLQHAQLGAMTLFLVPIQADARGLVLEAVFT